MEEADAEQQPLGYSCFTFPHQPEPLYTAQRTYAEAQGCPNTNFLKGVKWSPDGACLLTARDDDWLRVYDIPADVLQREPEPASPAAAAAAADAQAAPAAHGGKDSSQLGTKQAPDSLSPALKCHAGETIYDYAWYPCMVASEPVSCCFASTSRAHPIHLWDACTGGIRCTYCAYDDADEVTAAYSLSFSPDGGQLYAGFSKCLRIFDVTRPGRDCTKVVTQKRGQQGSIPGIISCIGFSPGAADMVAVGAYSGVVAALDARSMDVLFLMRGHSGGVTQVTFSPDGNFLYTGARQDGQLLCWDVRCTQEALYALQRDTASTNQRIGFDIEPCGRHLATGGCNGRVLVYDLRDGSQVDSMQVAPDTVNGCAFCPVLPLLATASGHRRYALEPSSSDDDDSDADMSVSTTAAVPPSSSTHADNGHCSTCGVAQPAPAAVGGRRQGRAAADVLPLFSNALRVWRMGMEWVELDADMCTAEEAAQQEQQQQQQQQGGVVVSSADADGVGADGHQPLHVEAAAELPLTEATAQDEDVHVQMGAVLSQLPEVTCPTL